MNELVELVDNVVSGKEGYKLGEPWLPGDSLGAVVPILREVDHEKDYYTLPEVRDKVDIEDSGLINKVKVSGRGIDKPIIVLAGEVFEGQGTQSRGVVHSMVVMPDEVKPIETRCVHASHGIRTRARFTPVGLAPMSVTSRLLTGNQHSVWHSVSSYSRLTSNAMSISDFVGVRPRIRSSVPRTRYVTDSLPEAMKKTGELMNEFLSKIPCFENQVGAIVIGMDGVEGIELFDHPEAWAARYKDVMGKYAESLTKKSPLFKIDLEACVETVEEFLASLRDAEVEVLEESSMFKILRVKSGEYIGEAIVLNGRVVHLFTIKHSDGDADTPYTYTWTSVDTSNHIGSWLTTSEPLYSVRSDNSTDYNIGNFTRTFSTRIPKGDLDTIFKGRKGWKTVLSTLKDGPKTWTELQRETGLSSATLTNRLKEAKSLGLITEDLRTNGRKVYRLTYR